ncbi:MAG: lactonase family protein [Fimbriimonadaceae bacterium]
MMKINKLIVPALSAIVLGSMGMAIANSTVKAETGFVYTMTNENDSNAIAVFARQQDGSLKLAGEPVSTGGKGIAKGDLEDQSSLIMSGDMIFAANPGSDTISVFRKMGGGKLGLIGKPTPSKGMTPVSLAFHDGLLFVANQGYRGGEPNITGFRVSMNGMLTPIEGSTKTFAKGAGPAQISFSPTGATIAVTHGYQAAETSMVSLFKVGKEGKLTAAPGSPQTTGEFSGDVGFSWHPNGNHLFVSNFRGSGIVTFNVDSNSMELSRGAKTGDGESAACWTTISNDGKFLYVANYASNSVSTFGVGMKGALSPIGVTKLSGHSSPDIKDLTLSPDGRFLYAIATTDRHIHAFKIGENGVPTELGDMKGHLVVPGNGALKGLLAD